MNLAALLGRRDEDYPPLDKDLCARCPGCGVEGKVIFVNPPLNVPVIEGCLCASAKIARGERL